MVFARVVREKLMHLRGEIRRGRCRSVSVTVVQVGVLTSASAADSSSKIITSREISFLMGSSKVGRSGKGLSCGPMKGYTISDMGASTHFLLERHFG